jgi:hypothetical protein
MGLFTEVLEAEEDDDLVELYHRQLLCLQYAFHMVQKQYEEAVKVTRQSVERLMLAVRNAEAVEELEERIDSLDEDPDTDMHRINVLEDKLDPLGPARHPRNTSTP